jgi:XTP/dITP diphosphohydrolase
VRLVLATRNDHKLRELRQLMAPIELDQLPEEVVLPPETGTTFAENALRKARAAAAATGLPSIADDSGIEAAALGGAPGVWSARYAGEHATDEQNLAKLLEEVPEEGDTRVTYVCAMAELSAEEKDAISHRGRAARELKLKLLRAEDEGRSRGPLGDLLRRMRG